ncbi:MAG TPA: response regulator [Vicinamibacterales bacterium]|jgi:DNA-binding response OmpR family regulator|nr:response regulator [Vicinamibacterales bacterium]
MAAPRKILVVDDDRATCAILAAALKGDGRTVLIAYDAMSGFSMAMRERPDLIVLDLSMPAGGGFSIHDRMSKIPSLANTPLVVITATDNAVNRERATAIGAIAFLVKPVNGDELSGVVTAALNTP